MIHLYIEGREVALPSDISFQYNVENQFVTEAEGYSLSIEVPLFASGNLDIFGMIHRMDADISRIRFDAQLITPQYCASGVAAVVGVSENSVKLQFLQGRSAQNFDLRLDETYVNELDLGECPLNYSHRGVTPYQALQSIDDGAVAVALPWVISSSGQTIHNRLRKLDDSLVWHPETTMISFMPYLIVVAERICEAIGYEADFTQWRESEFRHLVLCNVMPESLRLHNFSYPLPHWTVSEFFSNIEFLLRGKFEINNTSGRISFRFETDILQEAGSVEIKDIIDDFSISLEADPEKEDRPEFLRNRGYESNSGQFWNLRSCDWYIRQRIATINEEPAGQSSATSLQASGSTSPRRTNRPNPGWYYDTMVDLTGEFKNIVRFLSRTPMMVHAQQFRFSTNLPGSGADALFYAADINAFFCLRAVRQIDYDDIPQAWKEKYDLQNNGVYYENWLYPVNDFGDYILDDRDDADRSDLNAVPVDVNVADGLVAFLPFSETSADDDSDEMKQPESFSLIMAGKKDRPQYYDKLYVGFWTGLRDASWDAGIYPLTSNFQIYKGWNIELAPPGMSLRLNDGRIYGSESLMATDFRKVYKISFLSDSIPDPSAIFLIRGKRYICRKLTTEFNASGMSRTIKGEFYRLDL